MKTLDQTAELDLLRKKLRIMELEVEVYREMGGLAIRGASRSTLLSRLMDFALKAVDAEGGALYSLDKDMSLSLEAAKGKDCLKERALAVMAANSGKPCVNGPGNKTQEIGQAGKKASRPASRASVLAVPLLREKDGVSGVITASRALGRAECAVFVVGGAVRQYAGAGAALRLDPRV